MSGYTTIKYLGVDTFVKLVKLNTIELKILLKN